MAGDAAVMVDPTSVEAIGNGLVELLESPELRRELVGRGLARASGYRWSEIAERTIEVYRRAAGHR